MSAVGDMEMLVKAKGYALRLFKLRPRSIQELRDKLAGRKYPPGVVDQIVRSCTAQGLLDDGAFARVWVQGRIKRYGRRRLELELAQKGVSEEISGALWQEGCLDHDEETTARELAQRRLILYKLVDPLKKKRRVMEYLARRGFSTGTINKVLKEL